MAVSENTQRRVGAALRKIRARSAEVESEPGHGDLRQADRAGDAVVDAEIGGVDLEVRLEGDVDAVEAEPRLVHQIRAEDVGLVQGHDLAVRVAGVAETGNGVALQGRLAAAVALERVVAVQRVVLTEAVAHVAGPLIDIDRRRRRTEEAALP